MIGKEAFAQATSHTSGCIDIKLIKRTIDVGLKERKGSCTPYCGSGFWCQDGHMTDLGTLPGGNFSEANGINPAGVIVGEAQTASGISHAFRYEDGHMTDLGTLPGGDAAIATAINPAGVVVGESSNTVGGDHAYHAVRWQK